MQEELIRHGLQNALDKTDGTVIIACRRHIRRMKRRNPAYRKFQRMFRRANRSFEECNGPPAKVRRMRFDPWVSPIDRYALNAANRVLTRIERIKAAASYTNFCCRNGGSNLNAGTLLGDTTEPGTAASFSYTGGSFATNTFTVGSGNPQSDGVAAGQFCHVSDGTNIGRIARISSVTTTTIVLSATATLGSGTGATQAKVGGAWAGPTGAVAGTAAFPFNFMAQQTLTNATGNYTRINMKGGTTYTITAALTNGAGVVLVQGYTTTYGDLGRATIDAGGSAISIFSSNSQSLHFRDMIFSNVGDVGNHTGFVSASRLFFERCVLHDFGGFAVDISGGLYAGCRETEFYNGNMSNTASQGSLKTGQATFCKRCTFHGGGGTTNTSHITCAAGSAVMVETSVFDSAGQYGIFNNAASSALIEINSSEFYNSVSHAIYINAGSDYIAIENCNFCKNGGWGINLNQSCNGTIYNCGFGSGSQVNTSGTINYNVAAEVEEIGTVTYASGVTPWNSPTTGDFTITLAAAENAGRGVFTSTGPSWSGTVGKPDIGAATHAAAASGGPVGTNFRGGFSN